MNEKFGFADIDLTAPDIVINALLEELSVEINGLICGKIQPYSGNVISYTKSGISSIAALGTADKEVDIRNDLGKIEQKHISLNVICTLPNTKNIGIGCFYVSNYPATIVLEASIVRSVPGTKGGSVFTCNTRDELEALVTNILTSKRIIIVMQELIRVLSGDEFISRRGD